MSEPSSVLGIDDVRARVEERRRKEAEQLAAAEAGKKADGGGGGPGDRKWVLDCLANNERGDGVFYATLHRGRYVYEALSDRWLEFPAGGHHWQVDHTGRSVTGVEQVALGYLGHAEGLNVEIGEHRRQEKLARERAEAADLEKDGSTAAPAAWAEVERLGVELKRLAGKRTQLTKRVDRLRSKRGADNCRYWARSIEDPLAIVGKDVLDRNPMLLACANGVLDLETGELRDGRPDDWLIKASDVAFPDNVSHYLRTGEECPCPRWDAFQREILGDDEVADFWQRLLGQAITGRVDEQLITVAIGAGRNGKGVTFDILQRVLGDYAWVISPELLLEQKNARSSSGAAADFVSLTGRRLVVGAETDDNRKISGSSVKSLTGGDVVKARAPYEVEEINISPTWHLFLHTNSVPRGLTKDFALLQRLIYVHFPYSYVDDPEAEAKVRPAMAELFRRKDRGLAAALQSELPGILAWLVRGCLLWQQDGKLRPPARIRADVDQLRQDEDTIGQFLEAACFRDPEADVLLKDFYGRFETWHKENHGDHVYSRKRVSSELVQRGFHKGNTGGNIRIYGLRLLAETFGG